MSIKNKLQSIIKNSLPIDLDINRIVIDIPKDKKNGDYSTNVAFLLTKELKKSPILIAEDIANNIKDEMIDGDTATVTTQIEVYDYYKIDNDATKYVSDNPDKFSTNNVYDSKKVLEYKIDKLTNAKDRVTYTVVFNLTKVDNEWKVDNLSNEDLEKIHGIYAH